VILKGMCIIQIYIDIPFDILSLIQYEFYEVDYVHVYHLIVYHLIVHLKRKKKEEKEKKEEDLRRVEHKGNESWRLDYLLVV
jgi:hypothetical protein